MSAVVEKRNLVAEFDSAFHAGSPSLARINAFQSFLQKGLPDVRTEEYRFTPVTRALEKIITAGSLTVAIPNTQHPIPSLVPDMPSNILAFVNGVYSKEQSILLDAEIKIDVKEYINSETESDPFSLLNAAFANQTVEITVGQNREVKHPLAIVHVIDSTQVVFSNPRWKCAIGMNSALSILEYGINQGTGFNNKWGRVEVGENASLEYTVIQNSENDYQINNTTIESATNARVSCFTITLDGQLLRNNLNIVINGSGIDAHLHGLYLISKNTLADNHTVVDHRKANSNSNELYKGVMNANAKGVFNGNIFVRPDAQKTNAFQSNRNIIMSESATVFTKPQLEIWADDVKCSHGCTTGQLDEEAMFYLRSRGVPKDMARNMLLYAFAAETLEPMKNVVLKNYLDSLITERLQKSF